MNGNAPAEPGPDWLPAALVIWATIFNAILAIVNAHVLKLTPASVIAAETLITLACYVLALLRFRPEMRTWYALFILILLAFSMESLARGDLQVKYVRDVLIIPTFILLGLSSPRRYVDRTVCIVHLIVILVGLLEALDTDGYAKLFDVPGYYINTRGYEDDNFWNKQSDLFVSAVRPGERVFLPFLDLHRLSSIFLEPVSLGNYNSIITAFICARWTALSHPMRWFLIVGNVLILIGCDGRLAGMSSVLIVLIALIAPYTPRGTAALYLPITLAFAFVATDMLGLNAGPDDLSGRIAHTVQLLRQYDVDDLFALSDRFIWQAVDSGVAYLIMTQTIIGFVVIWCFVTIGPSQDRPEEARYTHAVSIYMSLAMMVSFSMLTIKTAALLWFIQGTLQRNEGVATARSPVAAAAGRDRPRERPAGGLVT
jgi:putative polymerase